MRSMGAAKMLAVGALLGGPVLVGLAGTLLYVGTRATEEAGFHVATHGAPSIPEGVQTVAARPATRPPTQAAGLNADPHTIADGTTVDPAWSAGNEPTSVAATQPARSTRWAAPRSTAHGRALPLPLASENDLTREAALVADARSALAVGDPARASRSIHATMGIGRRQLVPEELALEVKVLRALGRFEEANSVEQELKKHYPDSALAR
jgi:hypothetical protein